MEALCEEHACMADRTDCTPSGDMIDVGIVLLLLLCCEDGDARLAGAPRLMVGNVEGGN